MKLLFSLFIFATILPPAQAEYRGQSRFREQLALCGVTDPECRETAPTCAAYYQCEKDFLKAINGAWYSAVFHARIGRARACSAAYQSQKLTVEANDTTIDCVDGEDGRPHIGG